MNTRTIIIILAALAILNIASTPREHRTGTASGITSNLQVIDQTHRGQTLAMWKSSGQHSLPVIKIGRLAKYKVQDLDEFIRKRRQEC